MGLSNFAFNSSVTLTHNSYIYVTAVAKNSAGLQGISYSENLLVDLTPPIIEEVLDGDFIGTFDVFIVYFLFIAHWEVQKLCMYTHLQI